MDLHQYFPAGDRKVETCVIGTGSFGRSYLAQARRVPRMSARVAIDVDAETAARVLRDVGIEARRVRICSTAAEARIGLGGRRPHRSQRPRRGAGPADRGGGRGDRASRGRCPPRRPGHRVRPPRGHGQQGGRRRGGPGPRRARGREGAGRDSRRRRPAEPADRAGELGRGAGLRDHRRRQVQRMRLRLRCRERAARAATASWSTHRSSARCGRSARGNVAELVAARAKAASALPQRVVADRCELAIVANSTGLGADRPLLHAPIARPVEIADVLALERNGGLLSGPRKIDVFNALRAPNEAELRRRRVRADLLQRRPRELGPAGRQGSRRQPRRLHRHGLPAAPLAGRWRPRPACSTPRSTAARRAPRCRGRTST